MEESVIGPTTSTVAVASSSESNTERSMGRRRKRMKGFLKSVIENVETLVLTPQTRRPAWFKELSKNDDGWVHLQPVIEKLSTDDANLKTAFASKGFLPLLRESKVLVVDPSGKSIRAKRDREQEPGVPANSDCIIFVDNLPGRADDAWISKTFSPYGRLVDAWVIKPKNKAAVAARKREEEERKSGNTKLSPDGHRRNKGFGFVQFAQATDAEQLLNRFRRGLAGQLIVAKADKSAEKTASRKTEIVAAECSETATLRKVGLVAGGSVVEESSKNDDGDRLEKKVEANDWIILSNDNANDGTGSKKETNTSGDGETSTTDPTSKRINTTDDAEPATKRFRTEESDDDLLAMEPPLFNGHLSRQAADQPMSPKKKRHRKKNTPASKKKLHEKETYDRMISSLRLYSWIEWRNCKKDFLLKQRANYSKLKSDLKDWRNTDGRGVTGVLAKKDRYPEEKELRGQEKITMKAESVTKMRLHSSTSDNPGDRVKPQVPE